MFCQMLQTSCKNFLHPHYIPTIQELISEKWKCWLHFPWGIWHSNYFIIHGFRDSWLRVRGIGWVWLCGAQKTGYLLWILDESSQAWPADFPPLGRHLQCRFQVTFPSAVLTPITLKYKLCGMAVDIWLLAPLAPFLCSNSAPIFFHNMTSTPRSSLLHPDGLQIPLVQCSSSCRPPI